jgi:hypothetical protein
MRLCADFSSQRTLKMRKRVENGETSARWQVRFP